MGLDFYTALIICTNIAMIIIDMFGAMYLFNIELNAVSLVNLVMVNGKFLCFVLSLICFLILIHLKGCWYICGVLCTYSP